MRATGPGQPAHLLLDIVGLLTELEIPYALVGAFAVSYYGVPRYTNDADTVIWLKDTGKTSKDLTNALLNAGYQVKFRQGDLDDPISASILAEDAHENRIDILIGVRGMDPDAVRRCVSSTLLDSSIRIIAAEDLIAMKVFAGGFQDLEDVKGILQVSRELLNLDLLRKLAGAYGVEVARKLEEILDQLPQLPPTT